jgi:hypothetical protein
MRIHLHDTFGYSVCGIPVPVGAQTVHVEDVTCRRCVKSARKKGR